MSTTLTETARVPTAVAHASGAIGSLVLPSVFGFVGPLIVMALYRDDPVVWRHAREAALFQVAMSLAAWLIALLAGASCFFFWIGLLAVLPWAASVILPIVGAVRVLQREPFAYPITAGLLD